MPPARTPKHTVHDDASHPLGVPPEFKVGAGGTQPSESRTEIHTPAESASEMRERKSILHGAWGGGWKTR